MPVNSSPSPVSSDTLTAVLNGATPAHVLGRVEQHLGLLGADPLMNVRIDTADEPGTGFEVVHPRTDCHDASPMADVEAAHWVALAHQGRLCQRCLGLLREEPDSLTARQVTGSLVMLVAYRLVRALTEDATPVQQAARLTDVADLAAWVLRLVPGDFTEALVELMVAIDVKLIELDAASPALSLVR